MQGWLAWLVAAMLTTAPCTGRTPLSVQPYAGPDAGRPSAATRRRTAEDLLTLFAGGSLPSKAWEKKLRASFAVLETSPAQRALWASLDARAAAEGPRGLQALLGPQLFPVPDIEGATERRCQLTAFPFGQRFAPGSGLGGLVPGLFRALANESARLGLPQVALSRWDLFHAHLFYHAPQRGVGLLFHAKEYPAPDAAAFPYDLGFCQRGSPLAFDGRAMDLRNSVLWRGRLHTLDVGEGSPLHAALIMDGLQPVRTVLESDFGAGVMDLNYFEGLAGRPPEERVFICRGAPLEGAEGGWGDRDGRANGAALAAGVPKDDGRLL